MKVKKLIGLKVNADTGVLESIACDDELEIFYEHIGCEWIDIPHRKIGDKYYPIISDDEGLFKEHPVCTAIDPAGNQMLVGTLLIFNDGFEGELDSLTADDIKNIQRNVYYGIYPDGRMQAVIMADY